MKNVIRLLNPFARREGSPTSMPAALPHWDTATLTRLLQLVRNPAALQLLIADSVTGNYHSFQTKLLGFDADTGEIMLDNPLPTDLHLLARARDERCSVQVRARFDDQFLCLDGYLSVLSVTSGGDLLLEMQCENYHTTRDRRLYPRVSFERLQQPTVVLSPDGQPALKAQLADISRQGARIVHYGRDIRDQLGGNAGQRIEIPLEIHFNEHFSLSCRARILQSQYLRSRGCHNLLRVRFEQPDPTFQAQIDELIACMGSTGELAA